MRSYIYGMLLLAVVLISFPLPAAGYEMYLPEGLDIDIILEPQDLERTGGDKKKMFQLNEAGQPTLLSGETFLTLKSSEGMEVVPPFRVEGSGGISHYAWMRDGTLMIISGRRLGILTTEGFRPILTLPSEHMKVEPASDDLCYLYGGRTKEQQRNMYLLKKGGKLLHLLQADEPVTAAAGDGDTTFIASGGSVFALTPGRTEIMYTAGEEITSLAVSHGTDGIFFATAGTAGYIHEKGTGFEFIKGSGAEVRAFDDSLFLYFPDGQMLKAAPVSLFGETAESAAGGGCTGISGCLNEAYATASFLWPFLLPYFFPYFFFSLLVARAEFTLLDIRDIRAGGKIFWILYGAAAVVTVMGAHPERLAAALWSSGALLGVLLIPYFFTDLARRFSDLLNSLLRGFLFPAAAWAGAVLVMAAGLFCTALFSFVFLVYLSDNVFSFRESVVGPRDLAAVLGVCLSIPLFVLLVMAGLRMFLPPDNEYFTEFFEAYRKNRIKTLFGGGRLLYLVLSIMMWGSVSYNTLKEGEELAAHFIGRLPWSILFILLSSCAGYVLCNTGLFFYRMARPEGKDVLTLWHKAGIGIVCGIILMHLV